MFHMYVCEYVHYARAQRDQHVPERREVRQGSEHDKNVLQLFYNKLPHLRYLEIFSELSALVYLLNKVTI